MIYPTVPAQRLSEVQTPGHLFPESPHSATCALCWWNPTTHQDKTPTHICKMPSWVWNRAGKLPLRGQNPLLSIKSLAKIDQVPNNSYPYSQPEKKKKIRFDQWFKNLCLKAELQLQSESDQRRATLTAAGLLPCLLSLPLIPCLRKRIKIMGLSTFQGH